MSDKSKAIVVGVGPRAGLGGALCERFAREGLHVFVAGRTPEKVEAVVMAIRNGGGRATGVVVDTTREQGVIALFDRAEKSAEGVLDLVVYNAGNAALGQVHDMEASFFEEVWRVGCLGGFLVGREAVRRMLPRGRGTVLFTGATASLRGKPNTTAFAAAKAGLRSLAQSMARAYGPQGIHVAHVIIDGGIAGDKIVKGIPQFAQAMGEDGLVSLTGLADAYWYLYRQPRAAWTHELDLRTFKESF
ncbi:MAG: SDR family NAD(P)-dependent oxidoreductase [Deltaproteobacteria bacterium]|nr:MAG: SDR family NAD(P)-dependent oxidoreductase [Deltaproteobacteria bacterium]